MYLLLLFKYTLPKSALCRVLSVGYSAKTSLPSVALGKVLLLVITAFIESRTLGKEKHLAKTTLPSASTRRTTTLGKVPSAIVYSWRPLSLPSAEPWHLANKLLCRVSDVRHSAENALPSVMLGHSAKYFLFFFFFQPNFLWYVPTLCRPTCTILSQL
jgi:hypothetical protein